MTGGQAVVEAIRRAGVTHAFCVPGESFLAVLDAFHDAGIRMVAARHEEGAGFMAEAYAKATGLPGVAMASRGPGLTHLSIALHVAQQDSTPLVAFIGQVNTDFRFREAFQEVEVTEFFRPITKWQVEIREVERIPELVQRAFRVAVSGRPGPVVVSLPEELTARSAPLRLHEPSPPPRPRPAPDEVERAAAILGGARSVAILAGLGVLRAGAARQLVELAELLQAPVFTAFRRYDAFPNDHPLYLGGASFGMNRAIFDPMLRADVILAVGTRLSETTTLGYSYPRPEQQLIHIDLSDAVIGSVFPPAVGIVADAGLAIADLIGALPRRLDPALIAARRTELAEARRRFEEMTTPRPIYTSPVDPEGVIYDLNRLLPPEAVMVTDAGNFSGWLNRYYRFRRPGTVVGTTAGAMAYGVPGAVGAKIALDARAAGMLPGAAPGAGAAPGTGAAPGGEARLGPPVICLAGDGGFAMSMSELQTAARLGLQGLVFLVFNNRMYGTIRGYQEKHYPGRPVATDLGDLDFVRVAEGLGAHAERVTANEQLPQALARALSCGRPAVIELLTRPERLSAWAE